MKSASPQLDTFAFRPLSPAEIDQLATISAVSFILGALALLCVLGVAFVVATRTKVPGRWPVFVSIVLLAAWWVLVQFVGGDLEATFGPAALLVSYTVYSALALVFAFGYLRMNLAAFRQRGAQPPSGGA